MLKKYFLLNILVMVLLNVLVKPVWIFLIDRNVQFLVGHEAYGLYTALLSLTLIFNILLDLGITNFNNRSIAGDQNSITSSLPNLIVAKALFSIVYFSILFLVAFIFNYDSQAYFILFLLGIVQMLNSFLQFLRSNVSANHDFKIDSILSILDKVVMIVVCGFFLLSSEYRQLFSVAWYIYTQIAAYTLSILVAFIIIITRYSKISFAHVSLKEMKSFCVQSIPYAALILCMSVYMRGDVVLLERLKGASIVSLYQEAYRLLDALNMFGFLFAGILLPMFTRMLAKKLQIQELVRLSANIIMSISVGLVAHSLVYCRDIMLFLDPHANAALPSIYFFVIASFPAFCIMYIYSTLLTANGNLKLLLRIALVGCAVSISFNMLLIPTFEAKGTAIAALLAEWTVALASIYFCIQKFNLKIDYRWLLNFVLLFIVQILLNAFMLNLHISLLLSIAVNCISFLSVVYLIKLWNINTLLQFFKQYKSEDSR